MSRVNAPITAAQEDAKLALASAAARAERQNQPKSLLYGAGLLLVAASIFLAISFFGSRAASSALKTQRGHAESIMRQAGELRALHEAAATEGPKLVQRETQFLTRIEQAGVDVGLKAKIPVPTKRGPERQLSTGSMQTKFDYEIKDEQLPMLLAWMERAVAQVPGLEVYSVSIKPDVHVWTLRVTFSRWEKIEGT